MEMSVFSSHTRNSCWRGTTPLEKKTESFTICYLVEDKQVWLPTLFLFTALILALNLQAEFLCTKYWELPT